MIPDLECGVAIATESAKTKPNRMIGNDFIVWLSVSSFYVDAL